MTRRRLWASLLGCLGVIVRPAGHQPRARQHPGPRARPAGWRLRRPRARSGATGDDLLVIRDLIRDELENRGIGEPDVRVEGSNIVVDLPGVKDQRDALDAVDVAGIVTLRPVYQCFGPPAEGTGSSVPGSTAPGSTPTGSTVAGSTPDDRPSVGSTPTHGGGTGRLRRRRARRTPRSTPGRRRAPTTPDHDAASTNPPATSVPPRRCRRSSVPDRSDAATTVPADDAGDDRAAHDRRRQCIVGPAGGAGDEVFSRDSSEVELTQDAGLDGRRRPQPGWRGGVERPRRSSATTASRRARRGSWRSSSTTSCSRTRPSTSRSSAGRCRSPASFNEGEARSLSRVLNRGAFPTQVEVRRVDTVSPTLGQDSLRASIFAGLVGIALLVAGARALLPAPHAADRGRDDRVGDADLQRRGVHLADHELRPHAGRRDRHHRVDRHDRRQLRRLLRADEGRGAARAHVPQLGGAQLRVDVEDDPRRQPRVVHRRRRAVRAERRLGARLRPLPRRDDDLRRHRAVVLHPAGGHPAGRDRPPRRPRPVRPRASCPNRRPRPRKRVPHDDRGDRRDGDAAGGHAPAGAASSWPRRRSTSGASGASGCSISAVLLRRHGRSRS